MFATARAAQRLRRQIAISVMLFSVAVLYMSGAATALGDTVWTPMWDIRNLPMTWEVLASDATMQAHSFFADGGSVTMQHDGGSAVISGSGDHSTAPLAATPGNMYTLTVNSGFHVRPHWDGVEWARLGAGQQAAGPGTNIGFQSDAELGFDSRWEHLPSNFVDTTWYYRVGAGETLSLSVEHMVGDTRPGRSFEFVSPSDVVTVADADGLPGSGGDHFLARAGSLANPPDPASIYWDEYTAPASEEGWWGFRLKAVEGAGVPYAWHYVLDRTDNGADQHHYLLPSSILDLMAPFVDSDEIEIMLNESVNYTFTGIDPDNGPQPLVWSLAGMTGSPVLGPNFDPNTRQFVWNSAGSGPGTYVATVNAYDGAFTGSGTLTITVIPEPQTLLLVCAGWLALAAWRRSCR